MRSKTLQNSEFDIQYSIFSFKSPCLPGRDESRPYVLFASPLPGKPNISFTLGRTLDLLQLSA